MRIDAPAFIQSVGGRLFFQSYPSWGERTESRIKGNEIVFRKGWEIDWYSIN